MSTYSDTPHPVGDATVNLILTWRGILAVAVFCPFAEGPNALVMARGRQDHGPMCAEHSGVHEAVFDAEGLRGLVAALIGRGYRVAGPVVRDSAIVLAEADLRRRTAGTADTKPEEPPYAFLGVRACDLAAGARP